MPVYGYNDWRYYQQPVLRHSWGTSPEMKSKEKEYNAKYYEEHKEEILKKAKERSRNSESYNENRLNGGRDFNESREGLLALSGEDGFESLVDETKSDLDYFDKINGKHTEYDADVLANISKNNQMALENISNLTKTVTDYINKNKDKLSDDDLKKLYKDLDHQIVLEQKRMINLDSKEGKAYVDDLLKSGSKSSKSSGKAKTATQIKNQQIQAANAAKLSKNQSSSNSPIDAQVKKYSGSSSSSSSSSSGGRNYGSGNSNMPTNASDLATIERERERARQRSR